MTGPAPRRTITPALVRLVGQGYLHNVVRTPERTCAVCATDVSPPYSTCRPCTRHRAEAGRLRVRLASQVLPIVYAVDGGQSGHLMFTYKSARATERQRDQVLLLGFLAFQEHRHCMEGPAVGFQPIDAWSGVPSTSGRTGVHPIDRLGAALRPGPYVPLVPGPHATAERRTLAPDRWVVAEPQLARGRHVLLVDDTWTSGAKAQSAAAGLLAAGARAVTVMIVARWMDRTFGDTDRFLRTHATAEYSPYVCPVTGGACPRWT